MAGPIHWPPLNPYRFTASFPIAQEPPTDIFKHADRAWIDGRLVWKRGDPGTAREAVARHLGMNT